MRTVRAWIWLLLAGCAAPAAPAGPVELVLLSTNDLHGALEQTERERPSGRPLGGAAYLATTIARERGRNPQGTLVLDAGDIWQGSALSNLSAGRATIEVMNAIDFDAAAVGNHDFDWGIATLVERMGEAEFPLLLANVRERASGRAPAWARSHVVLERAGLRVAVIGLITEDTPEVTLPSNVATLEFLDAARTADALVAELVPRQADLAVLLCHIGARSGPDGMPTGHLVELARRVRGEAAVIGGHTHQIVAGEVEGVPLVEAGSNGRWLGRITLTVDPRTRAVLSSSSEVLSVHADDRPADPVVEALVARQRAAVAPLLDRVVGEAAQEILAARQECGMGNLLADAMRAAVAADVALQNPGGVRAPFDAGPITYGEVWRVMPFDNTIVVFELTGTELRALLEESAADGGFLHVAGLVLELDYARPPGQRVVRMVRAGGAAIAADERLSVAVNSFMAEGGDGLDSLTTRAGRDDGRLLRDALAAHIERLGVPLRHAPEGRLVLGGR